MSGKFVFPASAGEDSVTVNPAGMAVNLMFRAADDSQRTSLLFMISTTSVSCILYLILSWSKSSMCSQDHVFHPFMWSQQNPIYCSLCFAVKDRDEVVQIATWHSDTNLIALDTAFKRSKESLQFSTAFSNSQV